MPTDVAQLIDQLRDIHSPPSVSFWPPAIGWWILMILIIILIVSAIWYWKRRKPRYEKLLLAELQTIQVEFSINKNSVWLLQNISMLIRRTVKLIDPASTQVSCVGVTWLEYLDKLGRTTEFSQGVGRVLALGPYQQTAEFDPNDLIRLVRDWLVKLS